jgi:hypothetical protein
VCIYGMAEANAQPNNPLIILRELDARLKAPIRLVLFGRGALALGFEPALPKWTQTLDLDAIIPKQEEKEFEENNEFWTALEAVNAVLGQKELYFTHLFNEDQIILSKDWYEKIEPLALQLKNIVLYRPSTIDLILSKTARADDPEDRADILELIRREKIDLSTIETAFQEARIPEIEDLRIQFEKAKEWIRSSYRWSGGVMECWSNGVME